MCRVILYINPYIIDGPNLLIFLKLQCIHKNNSHMDRMVMQHIPGQQRTMDLNTDYHTTSTK